jgi:hypothetical protein
MRSGDVKVGIRVKTTTLGNTKGIFVRQHFIDARRAGVTGTVTGFVSGHGGDAWWVDHDDKTIGVYCPSELDLAKPLRHPCRSKVGEYDHLGTVSLPLDMDKLAELLVKSNYGVHRFLSALIRARKQNPDRHPQEDRLMKEIERLIEEGEY